MNRVGTLCKGTLSSHYRAHLYGASGRGNGFHWKANGTAYTAAQTTATNTTTKGSKAKRLQEEDGDSIVISGISGRFPISESMEEFKQNLFDGVDMVTDQNRWSVGNKVPPRYGFMKNLNKFDANFFGIVPKMAEAMDPQQRKLMEVTFEAIVDAGINPQILKGSPVGVYVGTMGGESQDYWFMTGEVDNLEGYGAIGVPNFMLANRLSYTFDLKGPSTIMSTGCSASLVALDTAVAAIRNGNCEAAIVAGSTIHINPCASFDLSYLHALAPDGKCKAFDESANGFVRSEAVVAMLIQKKSVAKRNYATIRHIKSSSDGYKNEGIVFPSGKAQESLLRQVYEDAGVDPGAVSYFEAHGTGTPAGDPQELQAVSNVMCKVESRKEPLLIGSVKSNMGHGESAAGLCSIAKCLISIQEGVIPGNLHFNKPNAYVKHVFDGSLKVVTEPTPWKGGLIGISGFGLGGTNCHVILESGPRTEISAQTKDDMPILIPFSGRTTETVEKSIDGACELGKNPEFAGLLHNVFKNNIPGHTHRGYGLVRPGESENIVQVQRSEAGTRPLWFIFPGMGSQWNEMGKDLMKLDAYRESMDKSTTILKNAGVDLEALLKPNNSSIFNSIRYALVSITAVQIALYDTLMSLDLKPDGFIGHSSGEILCSYADGCLSAEESLLVGDARGRAFQETMKYPGGMAAVGLSWEEIKSRCPPEISPACNNAAENVSVSGRKEDVQKFVKQLQAEGIFAKEVNTCNCAPHSKHVFQAQDLLFKYMYEIYKDDRPRTSRWISSCIPEARWGHPLAQNSSPAYHVHNMSMPVRFHEAVQHVPSNAVVVEIAPHGFFQAILKGSLSPNNIIIAPMNSIVEDKLGYFMSAVGKIYNAGVDVNIGNLYPPVNFPVSSKAPTISSLIKWDHEQNWSIPIIANPDKIVGGATVKINLQEKSDSFLNGHKLDSRIVYPATGYLVLAWQSLAKSLGLDFENVPVTFENVSFERATFLSEDKPTEFTFSFLNGTGSFEIREDGATVVRGNVQSPEDISKKMFSIPLANIPENTQRLRLSTEDIYKELKLRGYNYSGNFKGIKSIDNEGKWAEVSWKGNWISFLDSVLQTIALSVMTRNTAVPVRFQSVTINPEALISYLKSGGSTGKEGDSAGLPNPTVPVSIQSELNTIQCPGVEFRGLTAMVIPRKRQDETLSVEEYNFTPYFDNKSLKPKSSQNQNHPLLSTASGIIDLITENIPKNKFKVFDVFTKAENSLTESIHQIMVTKPRYQAEITMLSIPTEVEKLDDKIKSLGSVMSKESVDKLFPDAGSSSDVIFVDESALLEPIAQNLNDSGYIVLRSENLFDVTLPENLLCVSHKIAEGGSLHLLKKKIDVSPQSIQSISIDNCNFDWLPRLQSIMAEAGRENFPPESRIYLTSQNDPHSGIIGLVKCLKLEPGGQYIRCIFDPEGKLNLSSGNFAKSSPDGGELSNIIQKDLVMNIYRNGNLGSYRHFPLTHDVADPAKEVEHAYINTLTTGDLTSLRWIESPLKYFKKNELSQQLCTVNYASMNFRDIMLATGKLPIDSKTTSSHQDCVMGFEFSGVDPEGQRVMGMMSSKALASSVLIEPDCMTWKVPEQWTLEEAATVPVVYATSYYALLNRGRLRPGQSVLIHSGTGGVGQAALNIALDRGCQVFTTVGTEEKRKYIKTLFPSLKDENIGNSRDCSFEQQVLQLTKGRGVDIVLNSLAEDKLQASVRCLAVHGKFLEIGAFDAFQNNSLGMSCFLKNVDFQGIFLNHFFTECSEEKEALQRHFQDGIKRGVVKPLPRTVFPHDKIEDAFRYMASGKHMGKVLIQVQKEELIGTQQRVKAVTRSYFNPEKSYVIVGGLGGLGLETANFLVDRGAKNLVLVSRSGVTTGYQDLCIRKWEEKGVVVSTPKIDLSKYDAAKTFIQDLDSDLSVGGIFNSGLVLKDALIEDQTKEMYEAVSAPKIAVTQNLDKLSREYCKHLDYFVVFSSGAGGRGNMGQTNYGFANSVMEQICEARKQDGLHGLAIQWGIIGEVGFVAEKLFGPNSTGEENFEGTVAQRISSCLDVLDLTLQQERTSIVSSLVLADKTMKKSNRVGLLDSMAKIFGLKDVDKIESSTKLVDLGMDSLIGMELKQMLERDYDLPLTPNEIRVMVFGDLHAIDAGTFVKGGGGGASSAGNQRQKVTESAVIKLKTGELDESPPLFIVHGIEGNSIAFEPLASKLRMDTYGFQYPSAGFESVGEVAKDYIEKMKLVQPEGPYNIAGYSAGASIALEMATQLENEHSEEVTNLVILDGCFTWATNDIRGMFRNVLESIKRFTKITPDEEKNFLDNLKEDIKINQQLLLNLVKSRVTGSTDTKEINSYIERTFKLAEFTQSYEPMQKYKGKPYLIKASQKSSVMKDVTDDNYNLQEHCKEPLTVHTADGNHFSFLSSDKVSQTANILNDIFEKQEESSKIATSSVN